MELYISEFSKYVITLLIAVYTYECFAVFRFDSENSRKGIYARKNNAGIGRKIVGALEDTARSIGYKKMSSSR